MQWSAVVVGLVAAGGLYAGTIGPNCSDCYGSTYTVTNLGMTGSTFNTQTYKFAYTIDTTNFVAPQPGVDYYIESLSMKVTSTLLGATLVSAPGGVNAWTMSRNSQANDSGCSIGGSGWVCLQGGHAAVPGGVYTWQFSIIMAAGSLLDTASVKVNYDPAHGLITSEAVSMPEGTPAELPLVLAAAGACLIWRKTRKPALAPIA